MSNHEFHSGHHNTEDGTAAGLLNDISSYTFQTLLHGPSSYHTSSTSSHVFYGAPARPFAPLPAHPHAPLSTTYGTPIRSQVMRQSFVAYDDVSIQDYEIPPTRSFIRGRNFYSPPGSWQSEEPPVVLPRPSSPPRMVLPKRKRHASEKALAELKPLALRELKEDETACIICMEDYVDVPDSTDELKTEHALQMDCGHHFGSYCLKIWLKGHSTCPTCRREVDFVEEEEGRSMAMSRRWQSHQEMRRQGAQAAARERNGPDSSRHHHAMGHRRRISTQSVDFSARRVSPQSPSWLERDQSNHRGIRTDSNPLDDSRVAQAPRLQPVDQQGNGSGQVPYREVPMPHISTGVSPIRYSDTPLFATDMEMALCMASPFLRHAPIINALPPRHHVHTPMIQRPQSMHSQAHQSLYPSLDLGINRAPAPQPERLPPSIPSMRGGLPHQPYRHNPTSPPPPPMAPTHQAPPNYSVHNHSDYSNSQPQQMQYPEYRDQHWQSHQHQMNTMLPPPNTALNSSNINHINPSNTGNNNPTTINTTTSASEDDLQQQQHDQHQHRQPPQPLQPQCTLAEFGYCIEHFYTPPRTHSNHHNPTSTMLNLDCGHAYHVICLISIAKARPQQPVNRRAAWCQKCNRFEMLVDGELPDFAWERGKPGEVLAAKHMEIL
ncbi:hypothetical protein L873DRAFT_1827539 [Choiromyces venosus 120613-1]|uniref:RING-type domain-containing protein n=1 Tax=Choiromyces venosus 120613-1 TaxID=1336337 RepID=A0A3N4JRU5_9PEZI|nr:hypothetical protein L873DRAFT_1827539 [Choiromyces venosus 120613-1]